MPQQTRRCDAPLTEHVVLEPAGRDDHVGSVEDRQQLFFDEGHIGSALIVPDELELELVRGILRVLHGAVVADGNAIVKPETWMISTRYRVKQCRSQ